MVSEPGPRGYLDKTLDAYRSAVKAWARDVLIVVFVFLAAGVFIVFPFIHWYETEQRVTADIQQSVSKREEIERIINGITTLKKEFTEEKQNITEYGQGLAGELSERLSVFARAVEALRENQPLVHSEPFPGASIAEQFVRPSGGPPLLDPKALLMTDYGLTAEDLEMISSADQDPPRWVTSAAIVKNVFHDEINGVYDRLNARVQDGFLRLKTRTETTLDSLRPSVEGLGLELPGTDRFALRAEPIAVPSDASVFETRVGKFKTLRLETFRIAVNLDATVAPLNEAHKSLMISADHLAQTITNLQPKLQEAQDHIRALDNRFKEVEKHLASISLPLKWLPLELKTFILVYPTFFAILFLLLVLRFSRLSQLREHLYEELRGQNMAGKDIYLALCVPGATIDLLNEPEGISSRASRAARLVAPLAILAFLVVTVVRVETSPVIRATFSRALNGGAVALMVLACVQLFRHFFKRSPRKRLME